MSSTTKFDPYNFDYKAYVLETYGLTESPNRIQNIKIRGDDHILNSEDSVWVERNANFIGKWTINGAKLEWRLFIFKEGNIETFYLLDESTPFICSEYSYERITTPINGIENKHIWNFKWDKGLFRLFFDNYILSKENTIISDQNLTEAGFNFWKYLFKEHAITQNTHKMLVMNMDDGKIILPINNEGQMEEFYTDSKSGKFRFVLKKI